MATNPVEITSVPHPNNGVITHQTAENASTSVPPSEAVWNLIRDVAHEGGQTFAAVSALLVLLVLRSALNATRDRLYRLVNRNDGYDLEVNGLLAQMLSQVHCDRVLLMIIENGESLANGRRNRRLTCTHEAVARGLSRIGRQIDRVPLSRVQLDIHPDTLAHVLQVSETDDRIISVACRQYMASFGVETQFSSAVMRGNEVVGYLTTQYMSHMATDKVEQLWRDPDVITLFQAICHRVVTRKPTVLAHLWNIAWTQCQIKGKVENGDRKAS